MTGTSPMRIRVWSGREKLRDYFLRLGAAASIDETGAVSVALGETDDATVDEHLARWTSANGISATIEPVNALFTNVFRPRLGEVLLGKRLITEEQLQEALSETAQSGDLLGRVLLRRRWLFEDELARALSEQLQIPYVNIRSSGIDRRAARMVPAEIGLRYAAIPIGFVSGRLRVAFADPCDEKACAAIAAHCDHFEIAVAELSDIVSAWSDLGPSGTLRKMEGVDAVR
jgi:type II secretion system (T2SS) protein E